MTRPAIEGGKPVRKDYLPFSPPDITEADIEAVTAVLRSGWITRGPECERFEKALASYTGAHHAVVVSSATAGLFLTLKLAGIGNGDEVITSPYTFAATANVIIHTGAKPVFADVDEDTLNIDPEEILKKITPRTKAIIAVHFAGHPADLVAIREIAMFNRLLLIEDAAHAIGAALGNEKIGSGKNPSVFSFHAVKNITTAEGGAVLTNDEALAKRLRLLSLHGQTKDAFEKLKAGNWQYDITVAGYKFNMTDIQAALGRSQLERIEEIRKKRLAISRAYTEFLKNYDFVKIPVVKKGAKHAWHLYPIKIDFSALSIDRDGFIRALAAENISSNVHFIPVHTMSFYRTTFGYEPYDFPVAYENYLKEVSLPIHSRMVESDVNDVIEALSKLFSFYKR